MGKHVESSKKNSLKPNTASDNNASWYTDTDGFLEHSPSGGSLCYKRSTPQNIILCFGDSSLVYITYILPHLILSTTLHGGTVITSHTDEKSEAKKV